MPQDDVAAKTGTAQVGNNLTNDTDDWMIAFAPATDPVIAVAVSVPYQAFNVTGAIEAGPVMKCVIEAAIAMSKGQGRNWHLHDVQHPVSEQHDNHHNTNNDNTPLPAHSCPDEGATLESPLCTHAYVVVSLAG